MADGRVEFDTSLNTAGVEEGLNNAEKTVGNKANIIGGLVKVAFAKVGVDLAKAAVGVGASFDTAMSQVAATMGTTVDQVTQLSDIAKEMGESTKFSATEAAQALNYLALAGYDTAMQAEALPTVLDLAAAGSMDLASASDMVTDAMSALGIEVTNKNLTDFGDQMAMTASKANTSVSQLGEAVLTVGGTARVLSGGTTEMNAALGVLANAGIKGAEGGTHLRNMILTLSAPTKKAQKELKALGVTTVNADGSMRGMNEIMQDLSRSLDGMGDADKQAVLSKVFNKTDLAAVQAMLTGCGDSWSALENQIANSTGAMSGMAQTQIDNLEGDITIFKSAAEGLGIAFYDGFSGELREVVQFGTELIGDLSKAMKEGGFEGLAQELGNSLAKALTKITDNLGNIVTGAVDIVGALLAGIEKNASRLADGISKAVTGAVKGLGRSLPKIVKSVTSLMTSLVSSLAESLPELITGLLEGAIEAAVNLICNLPAILEAGAKIIGSLVTGIGKAIIGLPNMIAEAFTGAFTVPTDAEVKIGGIVFTPDNDLMDRIQAGVDSGIAAWEHEQEIEIKVKEAWVSYDELFNSATSDGKITKKEAKTLIGWVQQQVETDIAEAQAWLDTQEKTIKAVGSNLGQTWAEGVENPQSGVTATVTGLINDLDETTAQYDALVEKISGKKKSATTQELADLQELEQKILQINTELENATNTGDQSAENAVDSAVGTYISGLISQLDTVETEYAALVSSINESGGKATEEELAKLQELKDNIVNIKADLQTAAAAGDAAAKSGEESALGKYITGLISDINTAKEEYNQLQSDIANGKVDSVEDAITKLEELQSKITALQSELEGAVQTADTAGAAKYKSATAEYVEGLMTKLTESNKEYEELVKKLSDTKYTATEEEIARLTQLKNEIIGIETELKKATDDVTNAQRAKVRKVQAGLGTEEDFGAALGYEKQKLADAKAAADEVYDSSLASVTAGIDSTTAQLEAAQAQLMELEPGTKAYEIAQGNVDRLQGQLNALNAQFEDTAAAAQAVKDASYQAAESTYTEAVGSLVNGMAKADPAQAGKYEQFWNRMTQAAEAQAAWQAVTDSLGEGTFFTDEQIREMAASDWFQNSDAGNGFEYDGDKYSTDFYLAVQKIAEAYNDEAAVLMAELADGSGAMAAYVETAFGEGNMPDPALAEGALKAYIQTVNFQKAVGESGMSAGYDLVRGINEGAEGATGELSGIVEGDVDDALADVRSKNGIQSPSKVWAEKIGKPLAQGIAQGLRESGEAAEAAGEMVTGALAAAKATGERDAPEVGYAISNAAANGVTANALINKLQGAINTSLAAAKTAAGNAAEIGKYMIEKIAEGASTKGTFLNQALERIIKAALKAAKDAAGGGVGDAGSDSITGLKGRIESSMSEKITGRDLSAVGNIAGLTGGSVIRQTINFYTPVATPDEVAKTMQEYATYGLARV